MASGSNETNGNVSSSFDVVNGQQTSIERTDDRNRTPRHPRWTREETLVLIEGKNVAESTKRGRRSSYGFGMDQVEPKWEVVSSHCRRHGVNRGPVQCRKRWSNLVSDFKKIKKWESWRENESYWMMRSDLRREQKLPGFFDREVYDVLDGKEYMRAADQLALVITSVDENNGDDLDGLEVEDEDEMVEDEDVGDGLFSKFEQVAHEEIRRNERVQTDGKTTTIPSPVPISEMKYQPFHKADWNQARKRQAGPHFGTGPEGVKKGKQTSTDCQNIDVEDLLITALERNTNLLNSQLEDQKLKYQLDRDQQKDRHDSLITALTKMTDALEKIANKI
ncbi:hypothetical protein ACS0TY_020905 [Phlomoides rotata]